MEVEEELSWLGIIRHGQSTGNVARELAEAGGAEIIDVPERDADVPLTPTGARQATAAGRWLRDLPPGRRPQVVISSPYRRAVDTAEIMVARLEDAGGGAAGPPVLLDERLRDRELGVIDLLTGRGVARRFPEEAARRRRLGKLYYRPPGGESWADVALRLRAALTDLRLAYPGGRILLVGHEAGILLLRYLVEGLDEAGLMRVARGAALANGSLTAWRRVDGRLRPALFNDVTHLYRHGGVPTVRPSPEESDVASEPV